jgi:hypothetical protein
MDGITFEQMSSIMGSGFTSIEQSNKRVSDTLEKIQITLGKKFDKIGEFFTVYQTEEQKKAKRDKEPKEVKFTKDTKQLIGKLDQSKTNEAILKEFRGLRQKDKGFISGILGPIGLLLGGVATLAFGLTKFPAFKKMFEEFKQGKILTSITGILQRFAGKDKSLKEMIRSIPFVGRLIDAYEGFTSIFQGDFTKGIKQLAFAIPGAEFIADFFGTSKARLLAGDLSGDKSKQFSVFGKQFTFEEIFKKITEFPAPFFGQIGDFFNNISKSFVDLYSLVTKGSGANKNDIITVLDNIGNYFPAVRGVTNFMKMLTGKAFGFAENKMIASGKSITPGAPEINIGDVFNEIVKSISEKINAALKTVFNIFEAIMNVFSDDESKIFKGLAVLEKYAPGLAQGLRVVRSLIDQFKDAPQGGNIFDKFKFFNKLDFSGKQFSPEKVYDLNAKGLPNLTVDRREKQEKELQESQAYLNEVKNPKLREATMGLTGATIAGTFAAGASYLNSLATGNLLNAKESALTASLLAGSAGYAVGAGAAKLTQPSDEKIKAYEKETDMLRDRMRIERQNALKDAENELFKDSPYNRLKKQEPSAPKPAAPKEEKASPLDSDEVKKGIKTTAINSTKEISLQEQVVQLLTTIANLPGLVTPGLINVTNQSANMNFAGTNASNFDTRSRFAGSLTV